MASAFISAPSSCIWCLEWTAGLAVIGGHEPHPDLGLAPTCHGDCGFAAELVEIAKQP